MLDREQTTLRGRKSLYHAAGLIEGTETIGLIIRMMIFLHYFKYLAALFALLCVLTIAAPPMDARTRCIDQ
jgi:hypothetical protein